MAKKPNQVEITEFSKKSLEQLKKTFAPSMESLFEARNKVNDGLGGLDSGGKGSKFGLGKLLKRVGLGLLNFAVVLGTLLTGVLVGFTTKLKEMFSMTKLGKWFKTKWTDLKTSMKLKWEKLILTIKENKIVKSISAGWSKLTARLSAVFNPLLEWLGIGAAAGMAADDGAEAKPKGKLMTLLDKMKKFMLKWPRTLAVGTALGRFFPWVFGVLAAWETIDAMVEGWQEEAKKPDATFVSKMWASGTKGIEALWDWAVAGTLTLLSTAAQWLVTNTFKLFGFDKVAEKIEAQPAWDMGKWATDVMKELIWGWKWIFGLNENPDKNSMVGQIRRWWQTWNWTSIETAWNPDKWAKDLDEWMADTLKQFSDWVGKKIKQMFAPIRRLMGIFDKAENLAGTSQVDPNNSMGQEGPEGYTPQNSDPIDRTNPSGKLNKGKTEPTSQRVIDAARKLKDAKAGKGNVHEQLQKGPTSFGFSPGKITYMPNIKAGVDADGVNWAKFGGWQNVVNAISSVWKPTYGTPTITSGKRSVEANDKAGGLPTSKHLSGNAFDLRNWMIPAGKERLEVYKALKLAMSTDTRKITGDPHLDRKTGPEGAHFHFQAAAKGITERINGPKLYLAGEQGPELVHIQPISDSSMAGRNLSALTPMEMGMMGGGNTTVINNVDNSQRGGNTTAVIKTDINGQSPQGHNAEMH